MKKLIFLLLFGLISVGLNAQKNWDSIRIPVVDTTVIGTNTGDISTYYVTFNFKMTGLDSSVIVHPGGSDGLLSTNKWDFHPAMNDSLPYTITRLKWVKTVNGITQNERSFPFMSPLGHLRAGFYLKNSGCTPTTKYLKYQFIIHKP